MLSFPVYHYVPSKMQPIPITLDDERLWFHHQAMGAGSLRIALNGKYPMMFVPMEQNGEWFQFVGHMTFFAFVKLIEKLSIHGIISIYQEVADIHSFECYSTDDLIALLLKYG